MTMLGHFKLLTSQKACGTLSKQTITHRIEILSLSGIIIQN